MEQRGRRGRRRLVWLAVIGLAAGLRQRQRRRERDRPIVAAAKPIAVPEPVVMSVPQPVPAAPYRGRILVAPSATDSEGWSVEIDDLDRNTWRGMKLEAAAITVVAHRYTVTLLDGDRQGQAATATVSYRYARGARTGRPESLQLNGKSGFS
jgi:hypothetical protein